MRVFTFRRRRHRMHRLFRSVPTLSQSRTTFLTSDSRTRFRRRTRHSRERAIARRTDRRLNRPRSQYFTRPTLSQCLRFSSTINKTTHSSTFMRRRARDPGQEGPRRPSRTSKRDRRSPRRPIPAIRQAKPRRGTTNTYTRTRRRTPNRITRISHTRQRPKRPRRGRGRRCSRCECRCAKYEADEYEPDSYNHVDDSFQTVA